jgi:hypothetical protein
MITRAVVLGALGLLFAVAAQAADAPAASGCHRECLRGFITLYLDALVKRNPAALPVADTVKFTEDSVQMKLGEGLWKQASGLRSYRQDFLDARAGVAGSHVIAEEAGAPVMLVLRLKVVNRKITEVETAVIRNQKEGAVFDVETLVAPSSQMNLELQPSQRHSREEAVRIAAFYPAGLKAGSFVKVDAPFAPAAYRLENGRLMAGPGCTFRAGCGDIKTQPSPERPTLKSRLLAVDEEAGIVWYWLAWDRPENRKLVVWEAFKVYDGKMHAVEAFMQLEPLNQGTGWE